MSFKLLAIRPLAAKSKRFSKNLIQGKLYKFYNEYTYYDIYGKETSEISEDRIAYFQKKENIVPDDLYNIRDIKNKSINVSAIVGKNGSGKSTILELLYTSCYIAALEFDILKGINFYAKEQRRIVSEMTPKKSKAQIKSLKKELDNCQQQIRNIESLKDVFAIDLVFELNNQLFNFRYNNSKLYFFKLSESKIDSEPLCLEIDVKDQQELSKYLFYTIAINYSIYGLNETFQENFWLNALFHKNDGYQTPIVINPYRIEGNIDINSELHLGQSRLIANCVLEESELIVTEKKISTVLFTYESENSESFNMYLEKNQIDRKCFIQDLYDKFYKIKLDFILDNDFEVNYCSYIFNKIIKISHQYKEYHLILEYDNNIVSKKSLDKLLNKISHDKSHITLKLRQALNNLRFGFLHENYKKEILTKKSSDFCYEIPIKDLIKRIKEANKLLFKDDYSKVIELIPLGGVLPTIFVANNKKIDSITNIDILSSGEQHYIFSLNSIIYHILNLNSVFNTIENKKKYKNVNIVLDEIELYFHPEFQRNLVKDLIIRLHKLNVPHINNINVIFTTHSPFILSDIPNLNILRLGEDDSLTNSEVTSFGANINDILSNGFYLKNSNKGAFVDFLINDFLIFYHESSLLIAKYKMFIESNIKIEDINQELLIFEKKLKLIDDPIVKKILLTNVDSLKYQIENV